MHRPEPFDSPSWRAALPAASLLVGPQGPGSGQAPDACDLADAERLLAARAPATPGEPAAPPSCLFLVDIDTKAPSLAPDLQALLARWPGTLAVLLYGAMDVADCARLFQAGLFAALPLPPTTAAWNDLLARVAARRERWAGTLSLRRQGEQTTERLRAHRRQLQEQLARVGDELIASQRRLELANRELTDHMSQLSLLYRFGRELSSAPNWDATLASLLGSLAGFVGARGAALVLRAAPDAPYTPRQTVGWEGSAWDRVLVRLETQLQDAVAGRLLAPGVFHLDATGEGPERRGITALPLEHLGLRLGYLLLLDGPEPAGEAGERRLSFLQTVQVILAEEVAGAQMLDRIRELGAFNARVLETVRSGIWVVDEKGRTIYCNRQGRHLLTGRDEVAPAAATPEGLGRGRGPAGADGLDPLRHWLPLGPDLPELFLDGRLQLPDAPGSPFARLFHAGPEPYAGEGRILRPGGETVPVLLQASLMPGRGRDEQWLVLVAEDLREAKRLEAERVRADALEGMVAMSAALAHEIRNPLMGLSAQAELLAGHLDGGDPRRRYLDVITGEVERINGTITRLLGFVRPYEPQLAPASLAQLARDCALLLEPQARERGLQLELRLEPEPSRGREQLLDAGQVKQVLLNLLLNAFDASPAGGRVVLALRQEERLELRDARSGAGQLAAGTVVEVRDAGAGFAPADAERLFRPFYTTKATGTGLGLSICRKIVAAHGGEIRALREGDWTVFRVLLPRRTEAAARAREEA